MQSAAPGPTPTEAPGGFLYVIAHPQHRTSSKIGRAVDPYKRLSAANTWSPYGAFRLHGYVFFVDVRLAEKVIHLRLSADRRRGEWFRVAPAKALNILRGLRRREINLMKEKNGRPD